MHWSKKHMREVSRKVRNLVLVLGDQLDDRSAAFDGFDPAADTVWMAEVSEEAEYVWSHKARIAIFLSAMRHLRDRLRERAYSVDYHALDGRGQPADSSFATELAAAVKNLHPHKLVVLEPGEWRVRKMLAETANAIGIAIDIRTDRHFLCSTEEFGEHAEGRKALRLEPFYHEMRRKTGFLMRGGKPAGGTWNYDHENRESFGSDEPRRIPAPASFPPDKITREVIDLVNRRFAHHPGTLDAFDWAVTREQAAQALHDFVENRLPMFGPFEDAMWSGRPYLYHSRLSSALNLHLLDPREAVAAAVEAYEAKHAAINSVEGFVRQIIGWREYIRGIYWRHMPGYEYSNELNAGLPLPWFYWTAETDMNCLREVIGQTLALGFAHHIQRLMVAGLFALLLGVDPHEVHKWFLAIYVDAVEWVEMPNVLGMSQFADGGLMATKPYAAGGNYISRMSNYCRGCRYNPAKVEGEDACPFSVLYWDFLARNRSAFKRNPRMNLQVANLDRQVPRRLREIRACAERIRESFAQPAAAHG